MTLIRDDQIRTTKKRVRKTGKLERLYEPNLEVRVGKLKVAFTFRYSFEREDRRVLMGYYPQMSLQQARERIRVLLGQVAQGIDPQAELEREKAQKVGGAAHVPDEAEAPRTWSDVVDTWVELHAKPKNKSWRNQVSFLTHFKLWDDMPFDDLTQPMCQLRLDWIAKHKGGYMANRARATGSALSNWAAKRGLVAGNPFAGTDRPQVEKVRERCLDFGEIRVLLLACEQHKKGDSVVGHVLELLLLTGCRLNEILGARWDQIKDDGWLHIPPEFNKAARAHKVFLSAQAWAVLKSLPSWGSGLAYLFPGRDDPEMPMTEIKTARSTIAKRAGIPKWTAHDLRTTFGTGLVEIGEDPVISSVCQNHAIPDRRAAEVTQRHYIMNRVYYPRARNAWIRWGRTLELIREHGVQRATEEMVPSLPLLDVAYA